MLLEINASREFKLPKGSILAVDNISFNVDKNQFIGIYGVSGSGKTTLLNLIGLLDIPTLGTIVINGENTDKMDEKKKSEIRNQFFGFLHQSFGLLSDFTAIENVELPLLIQEIDDDSRIARCKEVLETVGLGDKLNSYPYQLSGGQQQRVALARALVTNPSVILTDEPTGALDLMTGRQIVSLLRDIAHQREVSVIMVTHDLSYKDMFDIVYSMKDGRFIE